MAPITWSDVTNLVTTLSAFPVAAQADLLAWVNAEIDPTVLDSEDGPKTKLARIYLTAHVATVLGPTASGSSALGPLASSSAGGMSRSYAVAAAASDASGDLALTRYGRLFRDLVRNSGARAGFVVP